MDTMGLTKRVHFLMDPEHFEALESLARHQRRPTGERLTVGSLIREAIVEYLAKHLAEPEQRPRAKRSR
jgi:hypothetical protein